MSEIIGSFYLKKTSNGNLKGEFTNNRHYTVFTERAELREKGIFPFIGKYFSTWDEIDGPDSSYLTIGFLSNAKHSNAKYELIWHDENNKVRFRGEALLAEGMLIGHYVSV